MSYTNKKVTNITLIVLRPRMITVQEGDREAVSGSNNESKVTSVVLTVTHHCLQEGGEMDSPVAYKKMGESGQKVEVA